MTPRPGLAENRNMSVIAFWLKNVGRQLKSHRSSLISEWEQSYHLLSKPPHYVRNPHYGKP